MDAEVVNRTKDPVEVNLTIEGVPAGWDVNFNSRYPSFPSALGDGWRRRPRPRTIDDHRVQSQDP